MVRFPNAFSFIGPPSSRYSDHAVQSSAVNSSTFIHPSYFSRCFKVSMEQISPKFLNRLILYRLCSQTFPRKCPFVILNRATPHLHKIPPLFSLFTLYLLFAIRLANFATTPALSIDNSSDNIRYNLLRTGSVELTTNKILERGFLDAVRTTSSSVPLYPLVFPAC